MTSEVSVEESRAPSPLARRGHDSWSPRIASKYVFAIALLTGYLVLPGTVMPVSDTYARLEVAHGLWTGTPPAVSSGVLRDGVRHPWFGSGQSLALLPADIVVSTALGAFRPALPDEAARRARFVLVSYLVFPMLNAIAIVVGFFALTSIGFSSREAVAGALSLLFASSFLWHAQNNQENNLQFACLALALVFLAKWLDGKSVAWLAAAFGAVGFNLLIRLTSLADVVFLFLVIAFLTAARSDGPLFTRASSTGRALGRAALVGVPLVGVFLGVDRLYHWYRFGTVGGTYIHLFGEQARRADPSLPADFPFGYPFWDGFLGPFLSPAKSVFIYDPLVLVAAVAVFLVWKCLTPLIRAVVVATPLYLLMLVVGYAGYYLWSAESSWGDRFVTPPVHLAALLALPLVLRYRDRLPAASVQIAAAVIALSVLLQLASLVYPSYFELTQAGLEEIATPAADMSAQGTYFHAGMRIANIAAAATGNFEHWGLDVTRDGKRIGLHPPQLVPFLPFESLPRALAMAIKVVWLACLGLLLLLVYRCATRMELLPRWQRKAESVTK